MGHEDDIPSDFLASGGLDSAIRRFGDDLIGKQIGVYHVTSLLGAGGMGEVYRARDTRLGRDVAIKILPTSFASDPERLRRFEREARMLAALNHPHIGAIYGVEEADPSPDSGQAAMRALVLELVEGETLADRVARGPVPVAEALPIAQQIADALEAAHEHGIIHCDLKPANIKITPQSVVKVLDFGLAKAFVGNGSGPDLSLLPTVTVEGTREGVIAGTAPYMSPEQARGKSVDKRTDIWAFGCVLYEMLTGRRAFHGQDVSDTLATVLKSDPDWSRLPLETPPAIRKLLRRCLEKDPKRRVPEIAVARFEIDEALTAPSGDGVAATMLLPQVPLWRRAVAPTLTLILGGLMVGLAVWFLTRPSPPRVVRLTVTSSGATALGSNNSNSENYGSSLAISPDGTRLAYVGGGGQQIVVRALDQLQPTAVPGLGEPSGLFFSPDGQWIGFFDGSTVLKKVAATGGPSVTVSQIIDNPRGASWSPDGTIIFAAGALFSGLLRVSAAGGTPEVLTTPNRDQGELEYTWPEILPGGQAVLFTIRTGEGPDNVQIAVLDLATRKQKILVRGASHGRYISSGHLVYGVAATLLAVAFDLRRLEVEGTPVPVLEQVMTMPNGAADMSISDDGTLVYVPGGVQAVAARTLVWVDRQGREAPLKAPPRPYLYPRLSPDGTRVVLMLEDDIWIWNLERETLTRVTFDPGPDTHPIWTPDGQRVVFRSTRAGPDNLFWQAADGTGSAERLTQGSNSQRPSTFSPDGTRLIFREETATAGEDLMVLALEGERRGQSPSPGVAGAGRSATSDVRALVQTRFNELNGEISADGRWLAYQSNESGQDEVYVRPFPDADRGRWQVSTRGGTRPLWARSGKELFYLGPSGAVMSVAVEGGGSTFRAGNPTRLFEGPYFINPDQMGRTYDVSPDGQRFLMVKVDGASDEAAAPTSIIVVQHWTEELKRLVRRTN